MRPSYIRQSVLTRHTCHVHIFLPDLRLSWASINITTIGQRIVSCSKTSTLLPVETGRWKSIEKDRHICTLCTGNQPGDEKHYIFQCTHLELVKAQRNFFSKLASIKRSKSSLTTIMDNILNCITETTPSKIGKFLNHITQKQTLGIVK